MGHFERFEDIDTKQDHTMPPPSTPVATIWDMDAPGGPIKIKLDPLSAREYVERDPARFVVTLPSGARA
jgi:hypothetical protein